ncbi:MAG TPA: hypothetical protein VF691_22065, partial [Cytophagaceae bacterium]
MFWITIATAIFTLFCSLSSYYFTIDHWIGGFIFLFVPILVLSNILLIFFLAIKSWKKVVIPCVALIFTLPALKETFRINTHDDIENPDFTILSYNVGTF